MNRRPNQVIQPEGWPQPSGYANAILAEGRVLFLAGQIAWDRDQRIVSDDLVEQIDQVLRNVLTLLTEVAAAPADVVRMTWYLTDKRKYLDERRRIGAVWRKHMGRHYPAMTVVEVVSLVEEGAQIEIEATAVIPSAGRED